jgi:hypothetical protein
LLVYQNRAGELAREQKATNSTFSPGLIVFIFLLYLHQSQSRQTSMLKVPSIFPRRFHSLSFLTSVPLFIKGSSHHAIVDEQQAPISLGALAASLFWQSAEQCPQTNRTFLVC